MIGRVPIVRVSEDRRKGNKQPAVFRSWHPENGENEGRRQEGNGSYFGDGTLMRLAPCGSEEDSALSASAAFASSQS